jgi:hypothetical protein
MGIARAQGWTESSVNRASIGVFLSIPWQVRARHKPRLFEADSTGTSCRGSQETQPESESERRKFLMPLNFFALNAMANLPGFQVILPEFLGVFEPALLGKADFRISANLCRVQADRLR